MQTFKPILGKVPTLCLSHQEVLIVNIQAGKQIL